MSRDDCPGRVAGQHVDFARLQRGETVLRRQRHELDLVGVVEDRGRDRAAEIDVEAGPLALRVRQAEAGQRAVGTAIEHAAILDRLERLSGYALRGRGEDERYECCEIASCGGSFKTCRANARTIFQRRKHLRPLLPRVDRGDEKEGKGPGDFVVLRQGNKYRTVHCNGAKFSTYFADSLLCWHSTIIHTVRNYSILPFLALIQEISDNNVTVFNRLRTSRSSRDVNDHHRGHYQLKAGAFQMTERTLMRGGKTLWDFTFAYTSPGHYKSSPFGKPIGTNSAVLWLSGGTIPQNRVDQSRPTRVGHRISVSSIPDRGKNRRNRINEKNQKAYTYIQYAHATRRLSGCWLLISRATERIRLRRFDRIVTVVRVEGDRVRSGDRGPGGRRRAAR